MARKKAKPKVDNSHVCRMCGRYDTTRKDQVCVRCLHPTRSIAAGRHDWRDDDRDEMERYNDRSFAEELQSGSMP